MTDPIVSTESAAPALNDGPLDILRRWLHGRQPMRPGDVLRARQGDPMEVLRRCAEDEVTDETERGAAARH